MKTLWKKSDSSPIEYSSFSSNGIKVGCIFKQRAYDRPNSQFEWVAEFRDEPQLIRKTEIAAKEAVEEMFRVWTKKKS